MTYTLEKKVEGKWFSVNDFLKPLDIVEEAFQLGKQEEVEDIRVCTYVDPRSWSSRYVENSSIRI